MERESEDDRQRALDEMLRLKNQIKALEGIDLIELMRFIEKIISDESESTT